MKQKFLTWLFKLPVLRVLLRLFFQRINFLIKIPCNGKKLIVPVLGGRGLQYWFESVELWHLQLFKKLLDDGSVLIDVGCNAGQVMLQAASLEKKIHYVGFEINPPAAQWCRIALLGRGFDEKSCVLCVGLFDRLRALKLRYSIVCQPFAVDDSSATVLPMIRPGGIHEKMTVAVPFDSLVADLELEKIHIIKIDVEGAELEVIKGMTRSLQAYQPVVLLEVLSSDIRVPKSVMDERNVMLMEILNALNYSVFRLLKKDGKNTTGVQRVKSFPSLVMTWDNIHDCDYLCVHQSKEDELLTKLELKEF